MSPKDTPGGEAASIATESAAIDYFTAVFGDASITAAGPDELFTTCLKLWETAVAVNPQISKVFGKSKRDKLIERLQRKLVAAQGVAAAEKAAKLAAEKAAKANVRLPRRRTETDLEACVAINRADFIDTARLYIAAKNPPVDGCATLYCWQGAFYRWIGPRWVELEPKEMERAILRWLSDECCAERLVDVVDPETGAADKKFVRFPIFPGIEHVANVIKALEAETELSRDQPFGWIGQDPSGRFISVTNGLLDIDNAKLRQHTPRFFNVVSIRARWDPNAPPISETAVGAYFNDLLVKGGDAAVAKANAAAPDHGGKRAPLPGEDQIGKLQETVGYWLSGDPSLQKIFLFVGPRRSGKGTLMNTFSRLMPGGTTSLTVRKIVKEFGLQSVIGKSLAFMPDIRIDSQHTDFAAITEALLSISGEDQMNVGRKYLIDWIGQLGARIVMGANSTPQFRDSDGVLVSRIEMFQTPNSFYGVENPKLLDTIMGDADAILRWAVEGYQRLRKQGGQFTVTKDHQRLSGQAAARMDPIGVFIEAGIFELTGDSNHFVTNDDLWIGFRFWMRQNSILGFTRIGFFKALARKDWPTKGAFRQSPFAAPDAPRGHGWTGIRWAGPKGERPADYDAWKADAEADDAPDTADAEGGFVPDP